MIIILLTVLFILMSVYLQMKIIQLITVNIITIDCTSQVGRRGQPDAHEQRCAEPQHLLPAQAPVHQRQQRHQQPAPTQYAVAGTNQHHTLSRSEANILKILFFSSV